MAAAQELERLVVRLVGEGSDYEKVLRQAVKSTKIASEKIEAIAHKAAAEQQRLLREAAAMTRAAARPTEIYGRKVKELNQHWKAGRIHGDTYRRTLKALNQEYGKGIYKATAYGKAVTKAGRSMQGTGLKMTFATTLPVAGMVAGFGAFDDAMTKSLAIMKDVTPQIRQEMEDTAYAIARSSITSSKDLAKSYFYLASAGMDAEQSIKALSVVESFAVAGAFDMAQATDLLTDAVSALGLTSKDAEKNMQGMLRVSDVLVKANTLANASVQQFSEALTNEAGAAIKQYNMDLEEGVAILAAYADQGIKGNVAGSLFARFSRLLIRSINDNRAAFVKHGISVAQFANTGKNLTGVIGDISKAVKGMGPAQKAATLEMLGFEARVQQAILPLLGLEKGIRRYRGELDKAKLTTEQVAEKMRNSFSAQMKRVWNQVKEVSDAIGRRLAPAVAWLGDKISAATKWFRGLTPGMKTTIVWVVGLTAALGPLLLILGGVAVAIGGIMKALTFLLKPIMLVIKTLGWLASGGLAAMIGFAALAIVVWALADAFTEADLGLLSFYKNMKTYTGEKFGTAWERIFHKIAGTLNRFWMDWKIIWEYISYHASNIGYGIGAVFKVVWAGIELGFAKAKYGIMKGLIEIWDKALDVMDAVDVFGASTDKIKGQRGIVDAWREGNKLASSAADLKFQGSMDGLSAGTKGRREKHEKKISGYAVEYERYIAKWTKKMGDLDHKAMLEMLPGQLKENPADLKKGELSEVDKLLKEIADAAKKAKKETADAAGGLGEGFADFFKEGAGGEEAGAARNRDQEWRQMSLRRTGLADVSTMSGPKKQAVEDKAVVNRLDQLIEVTERQQPAAVLG